MSAKENEEIDKTLKELNKLSKDPEEVAKYEEREWSIMRYDVEMKTNRELGEKEGEIRGLKIGEKRGRIEGEKNGRENEKKNVIKNLHKLNIPIEKIAQAVELNEEEEKAFLNEKKQEFFAIAKDIHNQCIRKNIKIIDVGADILIAGTAIINSKDYAETIKKR